MPVQTREKRKRQQELEQKQKEQGDEQPAQEEEADKSEERVSKKRRGGRKKEAEASTGQSKPAEEAPKKAADTEKGAEKSVEEQIQKLASEQVVAGVTDEKLHTRVIEKGQVYFFYRQKQLASEVESLDDVQRLYILLNPTSVLPISETSGGESKSTESDQAILNRLLIIGKKQLPDIDAKTKFWGLIYKTSADLEELKGMMENRMPNEQNVSSNQSNKYEPAVLVGQGLYALVEHGDRHVHLAYALELPEVPGEAQDLFNIRQEDSFVIQVKNPMLASQPLPPAQEKQQKEEKEKEYSKEELESFHKNRWGAPKPLTLLNHPGTEVLIIGASHDIVRELGKPGEMLENEARQMSSQILKIANLVLPKKILSTPAADQEDKGKEQEGGEGKQQEESTQRKGADLSLHEQHKKSQESGEATTAPEQQQQRSTSA